MANYCYYTAKVLGSREAVEEFAQILAREGRFENDGLGRAFDFEAEPAQKTQARDIWTIEGRGNCAWSIVSGMMKEGLDYGHPIRSLESESERLHVAVELYSSETMIGFQEHVLIVDGQVMENQCVDYEEHFLENGAADLSAFNEEHGTDYAEEDINHNDEICIGGFGEDFGAFREIDRMAHDYAFLHDMDALREGRVQVCEQADGSISFFFDDTAINGVVSIHQDGTEKGFSLTNLSGDQVAFGEWFDLPDDRLRLYGMEVTKLAPVEKVEQAVVRSQEKQLDKVMREAKSKAAEKNAIRSDSPKPRKTPEQEH